jgi:predicted phage terminase large subunit-like protein
MAPANKVELYNAASRRSLFVFFQRVFPIIEPGRKLVAEDYLELMADRLECLASGETKRLIINMPPRMLKSTLATVVFSAYMLGHRPHTRLMVAAHTDKLAEAHVSKIRHLVRSEVFAAVFPGCRIVRDTDADIETSSGGGVLAVSFGAAPTGLGCDGLIVDDPIKADDAGSAELREKCYSFFQNSLMSRLNHPAESFVLITMQRLAIGDLADRLIGSDIYTQLCLPLEAVAEEHYSYGGNKNFRRAPGDLLAPHRLTGADVATIKKEQTDSSYAAQYQQQPLAASGAYLKPEWLLSYKEPPKEGSNLIQSWDTATTIDDKASFSVCTTWKFVDRCFYLLYVYRAQHSLDDLNRAAVTLDDRFKPAVVLIEEANAEFSLKTTLSARPGLCVETFRPIKSKEYRLRECLGAFSNLMVYVPQTAYWLQTYIDELLAFPYGRYDDQVDSTTMALNFLMPRALHGEPDVRLLRRKFVVTSTAPKASARWRVGRGVGMGYGHIDLRPK